MVFRNRCEAGRLLAGRLSAYAGRPDVLVLAVARGGVPVGHEVATRLGVSMDVLVVQKLGVPGEEEIAMGAIAPGRVLVVNEDVVNRLGIPSFVIARVANQEEEELARREALYRGERRRLDARGRTVILVDDGLATGASFRAAVQAVRRMGPSKLIAAAPVGAPSACDQIADLVDDLVCAATPEPFLGVSIWYEQFPETSDDEVRSLLGTPTERAGASPPPAV